MTSGSTGAGALELRGPTVALLDAPLAVQLRGLGEAGSDGVVWRARVRDDDGRVWRATAASALELAGAWAPAKSSSGTLAALQSLRPLALDVRVEAPDGRGGARTFTRRLLADGVRVRRWRDGVAATLFLPASDAAATAVGAAAGAPAAAAGAPAAAGGAAASDAPAASLPASAIVLDATAGGEQTVAVTLAAALLASRGVLAFVVAPPRDERADHGKLLATAAELLRQVPAAAGAPGGVQFAAEPPPVPPGVPAQTGEPIAARAARWDALLAQLGAQPRLPA